VNRSKAGVPFLVTMMVRIVPGTLATVSEDAEGI